MLKKAVRAMKKKNPVVFACSGCSFAGQLANRLALELDRRGHAEMSCLAGVGARKKPFFAKMRDREVWIIDGCPIECAEGIFKEVAKEATLHIRLHDFGFKKHHEPEDGVDMGALVERVLEQAARTAGSRAAAPS